MIRYLFRYDFHVGISIDIKICTYVYSMRLVLLLLTDINWISYMFSVSHMSFPQIWNSSPLIFLTRALHWSLTAWYLVSGYLYRWRLISHDGRPVSQFSGRHGRKESVRIEDLSYQETSPSGWRETAPLHVETFGLPVRRNDFLITKCVFILNCSDCSSCPRTQCA